MPLSASTLTDREWHQVRAALRLWAKLAASSNTHPSRMAGVEEEFGPHLPMTASEIEELLDRGVCGHITLYDAASDAGIPAATLKKRVRKAGLRPVAHGLYERQPLMNLARRKRYARTTDPRS